MTEITRRGFLKVGGASVAATMALTDLELLAAAGGRSIRIGVVGLGPHGRSHASLCIRTPGVELVGVCDLDRRRLSAPSLDLAGTVVRTMDVARLIESHTLDAVVLSVPAAAQAEIAVRACEAGKHVLLEQPCVLSPTEAAILRRHARKKVVSYFRPNQVDVVPFANVSGGSSFVGPVVIHSDGALRLVTASPSLRVGSIPGNGLQAACHEVDAIRRLFGLTWPLAVQCWSIPRGPGRELGGIHMLSEWPGPVTLHLTVRVVRDDDGANRHEPYLAFRRTARGTHGAASMVAVHGAPGFEPAAASNVDRYPHSWCAFIHWIRSGIADPNEFQEGWLSGGLTALAERAYVERRRINIDPETGHVRA